MGLRALGHDVVPFDYDLTPHFLRGTDPSIPEHSAFIGVCRERLENALVEQIAREHRERHLDVFFSYFYSSFCRPEVVRHIRSMGICTVNWYCNASYQINLVEEIAPAYDFCLVPEKFRLEDYRRIGANPVYCQEAANPDVYHSYDVPREYDVTFVGQCYGDRSEYIHLLRGSGVDVRVWGKGWVDYGAKHAQAGEPCKERCRTIEGAKLLYRVMRDRLPSLPPLQTPWAPIPPECCGSPLTDEEMVKMYSRSKVNLGFSSCGDTHLRGDRVLQVRLRDFEVPMSGGFYMVEYMHELGEFFDIGREVVCYHDKEDCVAKARYYLKHGDEREQIRAAGHARCLRDHTWQKRLGDAFKTMGLN
jgi:hypothetical protein